MDVMVLVGSCSRTYRTRKPDVDASFDGIESSRTAKIQVNKYTKFLTLGSCKTLFGFPRSFYFLLLRS